MHLHWELSTNTAGDCNVRSMSWMGRVPDEIPQVRPPIDSLVPDSLANQGPWVLQEEGWKLNRANYYQEGWLSTANLRGVVGVTYTTSHCGLLGTSDESGVEPPPRTNYNLRGHLFEYQLMGNCNSKNINAQLERLEQK
eukprot:maker-scaffold1696_size30952-snap-gene-0.9 protein:Tk02724 transcript:maker-scaffold1696_size30952-snap-gene-0.9-mRNA-1 annotation:"tubby-related protein 4"